MEKIKLSYEHEGSVARIILDDGKGNVLDAVMLKELKTALEEIEKNINIKLITFEGAGKHFSFGASVDEHRKELADAMLRDFHQMFLQIMDLSIPTLAKVSGQCLGGGFELAMACNFIFTDVTAKMGLPEITLGVFPPPASIILPFKIGNARAEELIITGRSITAEEGKNWGLANEVSENKEQLEEKVNEWITKYLLPRSASSLRFVVQTSRSHYHQILSQYLPVLKKVYCNELMNTFDANEGINSFLEKRQPAWKNC